MLGFAVAGVYAAIRYVPAAGWTTSEVTTGASAAYPELQSRLYDSAPLNATLVTAAVATRLPGWKVRRTDTHGYVVEAEAGALGLTMDEITVRIEPVGPKGQDSRVVIRSRTRFGPSDLGRGATHIRDLQAAMDDKLPPLDPSEAARVE